MSAISNLTDREPVAVISAIVNAFKTVVLAFVAVAVGFDWFNWTAEQTGLVVSLIAALFVLFSTMVTTFARTKVTPISHPRADDGTPLVKDVNLRRAA
jgi:hypothetical protein